ncbi:peptidoglycan DD-metalloendopeptidase family protein [Micromonospora sp. WMMD1120]|uniref:murein hydrolase activator EnvC family protein n=1 Tax=Micromonospora sp. WMMD1120 TaxID=3016106 RepID=UPI002416FE57|nr:M23 family metallopeptidase [Micromonospora sp. WMMD1120]MDG4808354.1 peptidoglycan DD-metalloendopeptidase family protein [Micromonospora sp. WMMD1120]
MRPSLGPIRRTVLLCAAVPLALAVQLCGLAVLVAAVPGQPPAPTAPVASQAFAPAPVERFRWPLDGPPRPVRRFDPPAQPWLPGHRGVDLAAPAGATVRSAGSGTVLFAGPVAGRPVVTVGHADGLRTTHEPVRPGVRAGQAVTAGTPLGELLPGHPGCPAAACLHWGLRRGEDYLDPLALLGLGPVRLLPVGIARSGRVNAGRAGPAVARPAVRTRRRRCRPAR